jgi:REP element-mobilizing transposase RayT
MPLFQNSVLAKYQKTIDKQLLNNAYALFKNYFHNATIHENIRNSKEEQFQEGFLNELFVKILGYTLNPNPEYNLITENKNIKDSKKADGAILVNNAVKAVIELKGTDTTDLGKIETQAFGYKNNQPECVYVITSNFEKLRFYIDNAIEYLEFNLFTLNQAEFELLYTCLAYQNILLGLPKKLKDDSIGEENKVTKQLYTDYSLFKKELYQSLVDLNGQYEPLELFKKSQKLLDRFLFLFFAEDRNLLPPNSVRLILNDWKDLQERDEEIPLYNRFKKYFEYLNTGFKGKRYDVFAYNGGLFKPDEILDNVKINDDLLFKHAFKLSEYDFESEIDVNILGHIFENSLNELDEIKAQLEGQEVDKTKTKRKKDGVFYTPKYITKYIVDNTVGKLCTEKKTDIQLIEADYNTDKKRNATTKKALLTKLNDYRNWLLQLTICDPACGSGAFLNQALDFLITEHKYIDELQAKLFGDAMVLSDVEKSILENNLFGVDLNEESVEIAKLSLWLRTAQPNRKLNDLNNNIKCGNSLIDDPNIAGDKAFNWQTAFPQVFEKKEKVPYHITTAIHDSRTSERMITYNVREKRANGTLPEPQIIPLTVEEETLITNTVVEIIKEDSLNVLAYNVCKDHLHLLLVCEEQERDRIVQKIKAKTARAVNILRGVTIPTREHAPLSNTAESDTPLPIDKAKKPRGEKQNSLWTQKYGCNEIKDDQHLNNTIEYIRNNRIKHQLPPLPELQQENKLAYLYQNQEHAFRTEYKGGFDVIIGNPPYVNIYNMNSIHRDYFNFSKEYTSTYLKYDLYILFIEKGINILKSNGLIGFIIPSVVLSVPYGKVIREIIIKENTLNQIVDFTGYKVFEDAMVETCILLIKKIKNEENKICVLKPKASIYDFENNFIEILQSQFLNTDSFQFRLELSDQSITIIDKIRSNSVPLESVYYVSKGIVAFSKIDNRIKNDFLFNSKIDDNCKPYLEGKNVHRYIIDFNEKYLQYDEEVMSRPTFPELHENKKILIRAISDGLNATYDDKGYYIDQKLIICSKRYDIEKYIIPSKRPKSEHLNSQNKINDLSILALLNSSLCKYYYNKMLKGGVSVLPEDIRTFPIFSFNETNQIEIVEHSQQMLVLNREIQELSQKFQRSIQRKFEIDELPKKLQDWYSLSYAEFIKELAKKKIKLSLAQEAEWEEYFTQEARKAQALKQQIDTTDKEIDQMVYKLYELTDEEIKIVEGE